MIDYFRRTQLEPFCQPPLRFLFSHDSTLFDILQAVFYRLTNVCVVLNVFEGDVIGNLIEDASNVFLCQFIGVLQKPFETQPRCTDLHVGQAVSRH